MGILISTPSYIHGDNISDVHNTSRPQSVLREKSNSVCYHVVHEKLAMGEFLVGDMTSKVNVADLMTNVFYGQKRKYLFSNIFMIFLVTTSCQFSQYRMQSGNLNVG